MLFYLEESAKQTSVMYQEHKMQSLNGIVSVTIVVLSFSFTELISAEKKYSIDWLINNNDDDNNYNDNNNLRMLFRSLKCTVWLYIETAILNYPATG